MPEEIKPAIADIFSRAVYGPNGEFVGDCDIDDVDEKPPEKEKKEKPE